MIISKTTKLQLHVALETVNKKFKGNIAFRDVEQLSGTGLRWRVTLKALDSHGAGARRGHPEFMGFDKMPNYDKRRHLPYACWHVHGVFFDSLPPKAKIYLSSEGLHRPKDEWQDRNIGTEMFPYWFSEACDCYDKGIEL